MPCRSTIELRNMKIETQIGTYGPADVVPEAHVLDLTLAIDPHLVLIAEDAMAHVRTYVGEPKAVPRRGPGRTRTATLLAATTAALVCTESTCYLMI